MSCSEYQATGFDLHWARGRGTLSSHRGCWEELLGLRLRDSNIHSGPGAGEPEDQARAGTEFWAWAYNMLYRGDGNTEKIKQELQGKLGPLGGNGKS